jgi:mono/diheme cytochrome c family protein
MGAAAGAKGIRRWLVLIVLVAAVALAGGYLLMGGMPGMTKGRADPNDPAQVTLGRAVYEKHCASCHGANLEGQPEWRVRKPDGRLPAPPHDADGHTWHHADEQLFGITKRGIQTYAPAGYESDMPAYDSVLTDSEIWATLAFIKSRWPDEIRKRQERLNDRGRR